MTKNFSKRLNYDITSIILMHQKLIILSLQVILYCLIMSFLLLKSCFLNERGPCCVGNRFIRVVVPQKMYEGKDLDLCGKCFVFASMLLFLVITDIFYCLFLCF